MLNEEEEFSRWWGEQVKKYPETIRMKHVAQAAYSAWRARSTCAPVDPADITITNLECL